MYYISILHYISFIHYMNIFIIDYINILSVQLGTSLFIICPPQLAEIVLVRRYSANTIPGRNWWASYNFKNSRILESGSIIYPSA